MTASTAARRRVRLATTLGEARTASRAVAKPRREASKRTTTLWSTGVVISLRIQEGRHEELEHRLLGRVEAGDVVGGDAELEVEEWGVRAGASGLGGGAGGARRSGASRSAQNWRIRAPTSTTISATSPAKR